MSWEKEGRRAPRLATDLPGTLHGREPREVRVLDLSRSGCLVRCPARFDVGAIVDLELQLEGEAVLAKARVAEVSVDGESGSAGRCCLIGLEFVSLPAQQEARLLAFVERERRR